MFTAIVLLSGCGQSEDETALEIRPVRVVTIAARAAGDVVALTGTVQAQTEINLSFRIDGRMLERLANVGENVAPGKLVAADRRH